MERRHHTPVVLANAGLLGGAKLFSKAFHLHPRQSVVAPEGFAGE